MTVSYQATLIIPTLNRKESLLNTLRSLSGSLPPDTEVLVVDQSSSKDRGLLAEIEATLPVARYFHHEHVGLPAARNFGVAQSKAEIVAFCDDDVEVAEGFLRAHLENYQDARIGAVVGRVLGVESEPGKRLAKATGRISRWSGNQTDNFDSLIKQEVDHGQGCNFSFRRKVLQQIGGFDCRFAGSAFLEDADACLRVKKAGYKVLFEPEATLTHYKNQTGGCRLNKPEHWYYWYGHNFVLLFLKNYSRLSLPFFLFYRFGNILRGALVHSNANILRLGLLGMLNGYHSYKNGKI
ncbi:MAG: glycosyltransferase family 2 protein [bacterium]